MAVKMAIIYYSSTGTTYELARAVAEGARGAGAELRFLKVGELAPEAAIQSNAAWAKHREETRDVREATLDDIDWADAIIFGTPTRYGLPSAQVKQLIDSTGPLWAKGKLADKIVSAFATSATPHAGQETTITAFNNVFHHWGCIIVGLGYLDPIQFTAGNPYGASHTSNNGQIPPDDVARAAARFQGRRVAEVAARFVAGRAG